MNFSVILPNLRDWLSLIEADIRETTAPGKARPDPEKALYSCTSTVRVQRYRYMIDDDLSKIPFLHTVYVPAYVLLVLVRVHIRYSFIDCMILVLLL